MTNLELQDALDRQTDEVWTAKTRRAILRALKVEHTLSDRQVIVALAQRARKVERRCWICAFCSEGHKCYGVPFAPPCPEDGICNCHSFLDVTIFKEISIDHAPEEEKR